MANFVKRVIGAMKVPAGYLLQRPVTIQYPDERMVVPDRYRGHPLFTMNNCRLCRACERACPVKCIEMDIEIASDGKKFLRGFYLDLGRCLFCGFCADACPTDCMIMGPKFELMEWDRGELVYNIPKFWRLSKDVQQHIRPYKKRSHATKPQNCIGCLVCVLTCPVKAISEVTEDGERTIKVDPEICTGCGHCTNNCPGDVLELKDYEGGSQ